MSPDGVKDGAEQTASEVADSKPVQYGARLGYAATGLLHLIIAWIALRVAWSGSGDKADQSGALGNIAEQPGGRVLLWVLVVGLVLLGLWHLTEAITGSGTSDPKDRAKDAAKGVAQAVVQFVIAFTVFKFASGGSKSSSDSTKDFTSDLMSKPFGRALVVIIGLVVLIVAGYHVYKGWTEGFLDKLREHPGKGIVTIGRIGYIGKGIALGLVGALFVIGGVKGTTKDTTGLDGALRTLADQPGGQGLLTIVALGIACYGVYSIACAKYAKV